MPTAHRQMDPARRTAGKKPDAAALGNARIVPRLFTSALGGRLSAWAQLFAEIRKLGYKGCYSGLAKFLSPWRQSKAETRRAISGFPDAPQLQTTTSRGSRQLSPQVVAALLSKVRAELTSQQVQIVDALKRQCPGFAVMRKLVFGFRAVLRRGKVTTLHRWMEEARKTSIHSLVRFVRTLKQDLSAVEAAVSKPWSNGPVEGHITRLKMLKRQMYGRAGIELLRGEPATRAGTQGSIMLHQNCVRADLSTDRHPALIRFWVGFLFHA